MAKGHPYSPWSAILEEVTVEYSGAERKEESRAASCKAWGTDRYAGIEAISRDM
jgi:hypothetical protein